jgi:inner membrane protein
MMAAILAGSAADLDQLSEYAGPSAFLDWHRTATHSLLGTVLIVAVFVIGFSIITKGKANADSVRIVLIALFAACALHVAMDLTQNESAQLLWPFRAKRYSADWVAHFDLWILLILLAGVLLPHLLALVTDEIGAKSKRPRGRVGAIIALVAVSTYVGGRAILHGNSAAMMEARTYRGELPRRVAAFAESDSPFHWRGMVETERAFHEFDLNLAAGVSFNPDAAVVYYKPESSVPLDAGRATESVRRFLATARFPKASVEKTNTGYRVQIRDLAEQREGRARRGVVIAIVETDSTGKVLNDELTWDRK